MSYRSPAYPTLVLMAVLIPAWFCSQSHAEEPTLISENPSITQLQAAMTNGELSSMQLINASLETISAKANLNAFITVNSTKARQRAAELDALRKQGTVLGPLHGIPVAIKDNIHVAGLPNTAGTLGLKNFIPNGDAEVIRRLKAAGAIIIGKANMHELAYGITSNNAAYGAVANAHDSSYFAGGSSGGTAVAIASNMVSIGLGTDTGGSSRIPAALNGITGLRPSTGRYPNTGLTRISQTRDTVGPMASSVNDLAILDEILSGETSTQADIKLTELRIGIPRSYFYDDLEPAVAKAIEKLIQTLKQAGVQIIEADLEQVAELNEKIGFPLVIYETRALLETYVAEYLPNENIESVLAQVKSADVKTVLAMVFNGDIPESVYLEALSIHRVRLQKQYKSYFAKHHLSAMLFPTTPLTARPITGSLETVELNGKQVPTFPSYIRNTDPASNAGIPGLTLPLGKSPQGLPIGVEIDGPVNSDRKLLAIGAAIEKLIKQTQQ